MAGRFTRKIRARKLIMTHFSSRYRGDESEHSMKIMWRMEQMARRVTDLWGKNDIIAAWDQMCLPIRTREDEEEIAKKENELRAAVDLLAERGH
jgi:ribonuclease Z